MEFEKRHWLAIVNPNAGVGKCRLLWNDIEKTLYKFNIKFESVFTQKPSDAIELSRRSIENGATNIIAVGGDGTLNEAVNGIFQQSRFKTKDITVAFVPVGTGNDWGRSNGISQKYSQAIQMIARGVTVLQDVGCVRFSFDSFNSERYFINAAGIGFDALVAQKVNQAKENNKKGKLIYISKLITALFEHESSFYSVIIDGEKINEDVFSMCIGIGKYNGGGMMQLPKAITDDGFFDVSIVTKIGKLEVIRNVPGLFNGNYIKNPKIRCYRGKNVVVSPVEAVLIEADGESLGCGKCEFQILPHALQIVSGK